MILINGEIIDTNIEETYLNTLYTHCVSTLNKENQITTEIVIQACDKLYKKVLKGEFDQYIRPVLKASNISYEHFEKMASLFSKEELEYKCHMEFGEYANPLPHLKSGVRRERHPLGILLHIAAGNVDGLPAYSVIEGLLAGNINILKLPTGDSGLSVQLLSELIKIEPLLKGYIYVFDVPSTETNTLKEFAEVADAVIVWGGDAAVNAAKKLTDEKTKIIAWGHKMSFAYVTEQVTDDELYQLAYHVCETNQVLCSSCQGMFVDTESDMKLNQISKRLFEQLKKANIEIGKADMGMRGKNTIRLYNDRLEAKEGHTILSEDGVSVCVKPDSELELSYLFRNIWVKKLPRKEIIFQLKKHKHHLQSCALLCQEAEKEELASKLSRAGVVRITGANMSKTENGGAHDGLYPLREYSRIVEIE